MKPLKQGFEASEPITVIIEGKPYEIANLKKSGIPHNWKILLAFEDAWREIDVRQFKTGSDLWEVNKYIENNNLTLSDLGVFTPEEKPDYSVKQSDYEDLNRKYPAYTVPFIDRLYNYLKEEGEHVGVYLLNDELKALNKRGESIQEYIMRRQQNKKQFINNLKLQEPMITSPTGETSTFDQTDPQQIAGKIARITQLTDLGLTFDPNGGTFKGHGFEITQYSIEMDTDEAWDEIISFIEEAATPAEPTGMTDKEISELAWQRADPKNETQQIAEAELRKLKTQQVPVLVAEPETPEQPAPKKPISLTVFGSLTPQRVLELQNIEADVKAVVAANEFVKITDAKTAKLAKSREAALLKASTSTEKIDSDATKFLNAFKKTISNFITPIATIARDAHAKQKAERLVWEDEEKKRLAAIEKAKTDKINKRKEALAKIPFQFNGMIYNIGTVFITGSDIENMTDSEFADIVQRGAELKKQQDEAAKEQEDKDAIIRELQERLAALTAPVAVESETVKTVEQAAGFINKIIEPEAVMELVAPLINTTQSTPTPEPEPAPATVNTPASKPDYTVGTALEFKPNDNKLLTAFDAAHFAVINRDPVPAAFIKCREFFKFGVRDMALEVYKIMNSTPEAGVKKSDLINQLVASVLNP